MADRVGLYVERGEAKSELTAQIKDRLECSLFSCPNLQRSFSGSQRTQFVEAVPPWMVQG
jgi:hypothetical protein